MKPATAILPTPEETSTDVLRAVTFTVNGSPCSTNQLWRTDRGRTHLTDEARRWKARVEEAARAAGMAAIEGRVSVHLVYRYREPAYRIDLDNTFKATLDGLKAFFDDGQIEHLEADRTHDPRRPGVTVEILPLDPPPLRLFDAEIMSMKASA